MAYRAYTMWSAWWSFLQDSEAPGVRKFVDPEQAKVSGYLTVSGRACYTRNKREQAASKIENTDTKVKFI